MGIQQGARRHWTSKSTRRLSFSPRDLPGRWLIVLAVLGLAACGTQSPDLEFHFPIDNPRYSAESGPRVAIDAWHGNFHTVDGRFGPFARLLRDDGYIVDGLNAPFTAEALAEVDVLVIANALAAENRRRWRLPNHSAFSAEEIEAVRSWVENGGALLLIADHLPFPAAAEELAAEFGVFFTNGYAQNSEGDRFIVYRREDGTLLPHPITDGDGASEPVDQVKVFTGQAFRTLAGVEARPLMVLPEGSRVLMPSKPRDFGDRTPYVLAEGLLQGAVLEVGRGRIAVFGEAAMFTAQVAITRKNVMRFGMSAPDAEQNPRFVLNVLHWLSSSGGS